MSASSPEEICRLFQQYMLEGDLDSVIELYDAEAVFVNEQGVTKERQELRTELAPFASVRAHFDFNIKKVIRSGDIALVHTEWKISSLQQRSVCATEVAWRQQDGSWRWLIGDPFTVSRRNAVN